MKVRQYRKAIVPIVTGLFGLVGIVFGEEYVSWASPEIVVAIGAGLSSLIVYVVPNATE